MGQRAQGKKQMSDDLHPKDIIIVNDSFHHWIDLIKAKKQS